MDKVIIDGIDISECKYLHKSDKNYCNMSQYSDYCEAYTDCYFKQLKRLEQENERLKEELRTEKIYSSQIEELEESLQHAKAENERLKIENKELKSSLVSQASKIFTLEKSSNDLSQCVNKLYQALQEIRDMATLFHSVNENKGLDRFKNNIIDKINEVIGAE